MTLFEIKHRHTGAVLFSLECSSLKLCLEGAVSAKADLSSANLSGANLIWADLSSANLRWADLRWADFRSAVGDFATVEESEAMLAQIAELVLAQPERLDMGKWHGEQWDSTHTPEEEHSCKTTHCMAGWAQALCPVPFIRRMDAQYAGLLLIPTAVHMFHASSEDALEFLKSKLAAPGASKEGT